MCIRLKNATYVYLDKVRLAGDDIYMDDMDQKLEDNQIDDMASVHSLSLGTPLSLYHPLFYLSHPSFHIYTMFTL